MCILVKSVCLMLGIFVKYANIKLIKLLAIKYTKCINIEAIIHLPLYKAVITIFVIVKREFSFYGDRFSKTSCVNIDDETC